MFIRCGVATLDFDGRTYIEAGGLGKFLAWLHSLLQLQLHSSAWLQLILFKVHSLLEQTWQELSPFYSPIAAIFFAASRSLILFYPLHHMLHL